MQKKTLALFVLTLVLGLVTGRVMHSVLKGDASGKKTAHPQNVEPAPRPHGLRVNPYVSSSAAMTWESLEFQDSDSYQVSVNRLHRESRSPLRAASLHSYRIQSSEFQDWEVLLSEGRVKRLEVIHEVGTHMARTNPERALWFLYRGQRRFDNPDQYYAFRDAIVMTVTDSNPQMVITALQGLERGGTQQDSARFFSRYWAKEDPRAAADHFSEIIPLRNMATGNVPDTHEVDYAEMILKSWLTKDAEGAQAYIEGLPEGSKRQVFLSALDRFTTVE